MILYKRVMSTQFYIVKTYAYAKPHTVTFFHSMDYALAFKKAIEKYEHHLCVVSVM